MKEIQPAAHLAPHSLQGEEGRRGGSEDTYIQFSLHALLVYRIRTSVGHMHAVYAWWYKYIYETSVASSQNTDATQKTEHCSRSSDAAESPATQHKEQG